MTDEEHARKYAEESISLAISMTNPMAETIASLSCLYGLTYKNDEINKLKKQVEQAKKIIKIFLQLRNGNVSECCRDKECPCDNPVCENINEQAEQFIREVEK